MTWHVIDALTGRAYRGITAFRGTTVND